MRRAALSILGFGLVVGFQGCFDTEQVGGHDGHGAPGGEGGLDEGGSGPSTGGAGGSSAGAGRGGGGAGTGSGGVIGQGGGGDGGRGEAGDGGGGEGGEATGGAQSGGTGGSAAGAANGGNAGAGGRAGAGMGGMAGAAIGGMSGTSAAGLSGAGGAGAMNGGASSGGKSGAGGSAGSGGAAGSGGVGGNTAMAAFDGRAMLEACGANYTGTMRACFHYPVGLSSCPGSGNQVVEQFTTLGDSGTTYDVTLRIRGVVELKHMTGGTRAVATGTQNAWYTGGSPDLSHEPAFNVYQMTVSAPAQVYYLNSAPSQAEERRENFAIDYQITFPVRGGATVTLTNSDTNCIANKNCGAPATPETQCSPFTLSGVTDPRVNPQPYNGQFILVALVQASPR